ncbi:MAG: Holliday junction branch migration DNA helicase RuvB [Candidatus Xiphinematobacter sp.]|nr:MAG: Holliday junction branch migration DNA helicase RuvB [Candidatus Xiphinematobacter sp.]
MPATISRVITRTDGMVSLDLLPKAIPSYTQFPPPTCPKEGGSLRRFLDRRQTKQKTSVVFCLLRLSRCLLPHGGVLFIDEIHRLQPAIEEYLYPAMEDFRLDIVIDQGPSARSIRLNLSKFTLVGATTRSGMISSPLRSRFDMICRLDYYSVAHLQKIVERSASLLDVVVDAASALEIARRSRGTPRIANNLLYWVRDYAQVRFSGTVTREIAARALTMLEIDEEGVDRMDKHILKVIIDKFNGGPVGISSLAVAVGEEAGTLEEVHEPYLIMQGYLQRTAQGRVATARAYQKVGMSPPPLVPYKSTKRKNVNFHLQ